jgi:predicted ATPase/transcriptional regulator with XRE-family HTH domain
MQDMPFGDWLRRQRKSLDLTRDELAARLHCSASTVRHLEMGNLRASKQLAESIAQFLALPIEQRETFVRFARGDATQPPPETVHATPPTLAPPRAPGNLPAPLTKLVGRKHELSDLKKLLRQDGVRLVTLTGPPGAGKTRLSIALASAMTPAEFCDGIYFVRLESVADPDLVPHAIARTLGVSEESTNVLLALGDWVRDKRLLLVLDNFEQVISAAPIVTELLTAAPLLKIIATSRESLHVYGEHEYAIPPLAFPDAHHLPTTESLSFYTRFAALQLFTERARVIRPGYALTKQNVADIARICAWLDGLPLAIEMAAAHAKELEPHELLLQLRDRLATLIDGPRDLSPRQQSLRGAIDWSYHLLSHSEKRLFDVLGVFVGGCREDALSDFAPLIFDVPASDHIKATLRTLVDGNLAQRERAGESGTRYVMLATLQDYARAQLRANDLWERARQTHAEYFGRLAQSAKPHLRGTGEQAVWIQRLQEDHANLLAALEWGTETRERVHWVQELVIALGNFWLIRGYYGEARCWCARTLALDDAPTQFRAEILNSLGMAARAQGDYGSAHQAIETALDISRQLTDTRGICRSLNFLGILTGTEGNYARASEWFEQALEMGRALNDPLVALGTLPNLGLCYRRLKQYDRAERIYRETADLARAAGDQQTLSHALHGSGGICEAIGDYAGAARYYREDIAIRYRIGYHGGLGTTLHNLATALNRLHDNETAVQLLSASVRLKREQAFVESSLDQEEGRTLTADLRARVGDSAFERLWAKGRAMSLDDVVALATEKKSGTGA